MHARLISVGLVVVGCSWAASARAQQTEPGFTEPPIPPASPESTPVESTTSGTGQVDLSGQVSTSSSLVGTTSSEPASLDPLLSEPRGAYRHDGFYMRFAVGFTGYSERLRSRSAAIYDGRIEGDTTGFGTVGEFAIGGTLRDGFVLGGAIFTTDVLAATFRTEDVADTQPPAELDPERRSLVLVGPFVDWYFKPDRGFHGQAALGLAGLVAANSGAAGARLDDGDDDYAAIGGGLVLGLGYEWFAHREWSVGILGRVTGAVLTGEDDADVRWFHFVVNSPSILFTATYH